MSDVTAAVRAALIVIGAKSTTAIEAAMRKPPTGSSLQEMRLRIIASAKAANKTGEPAYHKAIAILDGALRKMPRLATCADSLFRTAKKKYAPLKRAS